MLPVLLTRSLLGCGGPPDGAFTERYARLGCIYDRECHPDEFDEVFADLDQCVDDYLVVLNASGLGCLSEHCEYDRAQAGECLDELRAVGCDDDLDSLSAACEQVWTDCDQHVLEECYWDSSGDYS